MYISTHMSFRQLTIHMYADYMGSSAETCSGGSMVKPLFENAGHPKR